MMRNAIEKLTPQYSSYITHLTGKSNITDAIDGKHSHFGVNFLAIFKGNRHNYWKYELYDDNVD